MKYFEEGSMSPDTGFVFGCIMDGEKYGAFLDSDVTVPGTVYIQKFISDSGKTIRGSALAEKYGITHAMQVEICTKALGYCNEKPNQFCHATFCSVKDINECRKYLKEFVKVCSLSQGEMDFISSSNSINVSVRWRPVKGWRNLLYSIFHRGRPLISEDFKLFKKKKAPRLNTNYNESDEV